MKKEQSLGLDTICIHGGHKEDPNRSHLTPLYVSSTYTFDSVEQGIEIFSGKQDGYIYGRFGSPTIAEAESRIAMLEAYGLKDENGDDLKLYALLHASGMAAISTMLLANLKSGDKIITHPSLYGGTQEMIDKILPDIGIGSVMTDMHDYSGLETMIRADSSIKMMYLETPANPTLQCIDLEALCRIGKACGLIVCADNTFCTPLLQQPFRYQADFVVHSTTKLLNGHGTAIGGILVGRDKSRMQGDVRKMHRLLGGNSNAMDAFLLTNGLRTLTLRVARHCDNAERVAAYLSGHPAIAVVNYPGLAQHPDHHIAAKQMKRFGSVMSIELKGGFDAAVSFMNKLELCINAVSLGTCDTLMSHPASTTHCGVSREHRLASGITDGLIRISVGMETAEDIIADLEQALS